MDYMNLGVKSRKTGINAKQRTRDEYSMENIDDYFNDDDTVSSIVSQPRRRHSRKSSLLIIDNNNSIVDTSNGDDNNNNKGGTLSNTDNEGFRIPNTPIINSRRTSQLHSFNSVNDFDPILEEGPQDESISNLGSPPILNQRRYVPENDNDQSMIRLTPEKRQKPDYRDVPDLVADDDEDANTTRDNTSFNTSDNAILEDELGDDYELISEEDRDYILGDSSIDEGSSTTDNSDNDNNSSVEGDNANEINSSIVEEEEEEEDDDDNEEISLPRSYRSNVPVSSDEEFPNSNENEFTSNKDDNDGLRRSSRVKVAPLEYWRNEKIVYKRKSNKPQLDIEKIITYDVVDEDEAEAEEFQRQRKKKKAATRTRPYNYVPTGKPRGRPRKTPNYDPNGMNPNKEILDEISSGSIHSANWLKKGILQTNVNVNLNTKGDEIVGFGPNIAQSAQSKETKEENYSLEVMFDKHKEHFASGMLKLPIHAKKKLSDSYNTFMTFYIIQGIVEVTLSNNKFIMTEGSTLQVPAFNEYAFENIGRNEVKMFFVQVSVPEDFNSDPNRKVSSVSSIMESEDEEDGEEDEFSLKTDNNLKETRNEKSENNSPVPSNMSLGSTMSLSEI
ncbi:hypothetical protein Kpol_1055p23 [Vanderwaltozyma polyspora DSM 70294]|uniref:CENP-C homolog n=1 Tax=Vanderwaltozyma polyspora (strain ATCC 22028 / DSM 70294 / BCRC 21397 / CBS 2163 / NBRC 10782 / NRRL Y-8283 / UCD 57-17) TaxID=436907 RepID=A7TG98_VANPO|nr:uncharacterized protein Kpol_1055p23 [Vanderwaltozyma polyspora DSM 70294]EDO18668.1 hypothetical protein Kpol_1055p23 [Vanderwaltozyma polyspora DSM 70294]